MSVHDHPGSSWSGPLVIVLALLAVWLTPGRADAHDPSLFYTGPQWATNGGVRTVDYFLGEGISTLTRVRDSINAGADQWSSRNQNLRFRYAGYNSNYYFNDRYCLPDPDPLRENGVIQGELGGDLLGQATKCYANNVLVRMSVAFDIRPWYSYTSGTPDPGIYDRWSVSSHEFGHVTGWTGHWSSSSTRCQDNADRLTMCPTILAGRTMQRTLGDHDYHTFEAQY